MRKWLKRIGLGLAGIILAALVVRAFQETAYQRQALIDFPPRGRLIDNGDHRIQLDCRGSGIPTVVFESGLDIWGSLSWKNVHDEIAKTTRACAYSRAGILWSDPSGHSHDGNAIATDLHATLAKAGEQSPFILVGHSLGGPYAVLYTKLFGEEVAGLVLIDPSHPEQWDRLRSVTSNEHRPPAKMLSLVARLPWLGLRPSVETLAPAEEKIRVAFFPKGFLATTLETEAWDRTFDETRSAKDLGARPLYILTAMKPYTQDMLQANGMTAEQASKFQDLMRALHDDMASWSSDSKHEIVDDSAHYIQLERPDKVTQAVDDVIERVRAGGAKSP